MVTIFIERQPTPSSMIEKSDIVVEICNALSIDGISQAEEILKKEYPHTIKPIQKRKYTEYQATTVFIRPGFVDRYSGRRLVFPGVLRLLSYLMPKEFPFHKNWKMTECHIAFWELYPTLDHIVPIARGGKDNEDNLVCTSMLRNSAKSNWLLGELGWELQPPGDFKDWDGLIGWYLEYAEDIGLPDDTYLKKWYKAAVSSIPGSEERPAGHPT